MGIDVATDAESTPKPTSASVRPTEIKAWAWSSASMRSNTFFRASFFLLGRTARGRPRPPDACTDEDEDDEEDEEDDARGVDLTSEDADVADAMALAAAAAIAMDAADRAEDEAAAEGSAGTGSA